MKRVTENHAVRRVIIAILHYLRDHPLAKDSAQGIAKWWIGEERELVEKALAFLVKEGVMQKKRHFYQIAPGQIVANETVNVEKILQQFSNES